MANAVTRRFLVALVSVALLAAACSDDSEGDPSAADEVETVVSLVQAEHSLLEEIIARSTLRCGVAGDAIGFSLTQPDRTQEGFEADFCRVLAAAIVGDATAVEFVPLSVAERFTAVVDGDVDVVLRGIPWTQQLDSDAGVDFGPVIFHDGQRLLSRAGGGVGAESGVADLDGSVACPLEPEAGDVLAAAAAVAGVTVTIEGQGDAVESFVTGVCDVVTGRGSELAAFRSRNQPEGEEWVIYPPAPLTEVSIAPVYREDDSLLADAINWAIYATIIADDKGVGAATVDQALVGGDAEMVALLGGTGELQTALGLRDDAFYRAISQVGNYDEIFNSTLGQLGLTRSGPNARLAEGGRIGAPPVR